MSYRIANPRFGRLDGPPKPKEAQAVGVSFDVFEEAEETPCLTVSFGVTEMVALLRFPRKVSDTATAIDEGALRQALELHALPRVEAGLRDGSFENAMGNREGWVWILEPEEAARLPAFLGRAKECRYLQPGADAFCTAGRSPAQGAGKEPIPTTAHLCRTCAVPDVRVLCSELHHVRTWASTPGRIDAYAAVCGLDKLPNPGAGGACRPGAQTCWRRVVEPRPREETVHISPLTLHEAFAFLDTVWRRSLSRGALLSGDLLTAGGILSTPCSDAADFREKVKALVDVFESFEVPPVSGRGKLAWLRAFLESWAASRDGASDDLPSVKEAITVLQKVGRVRAYYMHSDANARGDFEAAQRSLGIRLPALSYREEWNRLVARVVEQLRIVRDFLRKHGSAT